MSGPVDPTRAHSFVLFVPSGVAPPALPWAGEISAETPKVSRWVRLDGECHGDGKIMPRELYALVCGEARDPNDVIRSFQELALPLASDEALLLVHRSQHDGVEHYTKQGAPLLLAAARTPAKEPTPLLPALTSEQALRELVDRKTRAKR